MSAAQPQETARDGRAVAAYVERFGDSLTEAGMPRLASRVFARVLADDDGRMTAVELTEALDVSPAAISGAVRYLAQVGMIGKERERGSRRDVYVVQSDAWHRAMMRRDRVMAQLEVGVRAGFEAVGGLDSPAGRRLHLTLEFLEFITEKLGAIHQEWEPRKAAIMATWPDDA